MMSHTYGRILPIVILVGLSWPATAVPSIEPADFPGPTCGAPASTSISARFVQLSLKSAKQRSPAENLEFANVLLTLRLIQPLRELMPVLRQSRESLAAGGMLADYLLVEAAFRSEEDRIQQALKEEDEARPDKPVNNNPQRLQPSAQTVQALAAVEKAQPLKPEQAVRRALLLANRAMADKQWASVREIAQTAMSVPCDVPRSLLWQVGNLWLSGSYGLDRKTSEYLVKVNSRLRLARQVLLPDDPAILELLILNGLLAIEAKSAGATKTSIDELLEFQRAGSTYNHLYGVFVDFGERLVSAGFDEAAESAFIGVFRAQAKHPSEKGVVQDVLDTTGYYALYGSAPFKKDLYRRILDDPTIVGAADPDRYLIELQLAQAYDDDGQHDAADSVRGEIYKRNYQRIFGQAQQLSLSCDELSQLIDQDVVALSLVALAHREVAYSRCMKDDPDPASRKNVVLTLTLADTDRHFGAGQKARDILADYRKRIGNVAGTSDDSVREVQVAFQMLAESSEKTGDRSDADDTRKLQSDWLYHVSIQRAYVILRGEKPWEDIGLVTYLAKAAEQAKLSRREQEALEQYLRVIDTLAFDLHTHTDDAMGINLRMISLLQDAAMLANSARLPLAGDLERIEKSQALSSTYEKTCGLLGTIAIADFGGRHCISVAPAAANPQSSGSPTTSQRAGGTQQAPPEFVASAIRRGTELDVDPGILPEAPDVDLFSRLMAFLRDTPTAVTTLSSLDIVQTASLARFVGRLGAFAADKRRDVILLEAAGRALRKSGAKDVNKAEATAAVLDSAVVVIKASYLPASDVLAPLAALVEQVSGTNDLMVTSNLQWATRWQADWTDAVRGSDESLRQYRMMRQTSNEQGRRLIPHFDVMNAAEGAFRDLIRANRFREARDFVGEWLKEDGDWIAPTLIASAFPSGGSGTHCVDPTGPPVLRECLETYLYVYEQWLGRKTPWDPDDDALNEAAVLAEMTRGEDQAQLVQSVVHIGDRQSPEVSRAALSLLRRFEARTRLPNSYHNIEDYENALRSYRKLESESVGDPAKRTELEQGWVALVHQRLALSDALKSLDRVELQPTFQLDELRRGLRPEEAVLAFYIGRQNSVGVLVRGAVVRVYPLSVTSESVARAIGSLRSSELRSGLTFFDGTFPVALAYELYRRLIAPFEDDLTGATHLLIDPGSVLFELPFASLVRSPPRDTWSVQSNWTPEWLVSKYALRLVPQLTVFGPLRRAYVPSKASRSLFLGGDPQLSGTLSPFDQGFNAQGGNAARLVRALGRLKGADNEIDTLKREFGVKEGSILVGPRFTKQQFESSELQEYRAILLATHAVGGTRDTPPFLVFTPQSNGDAGNDGDGNGGDAVNDGALLPSEAALLSLDANVVVLSACRTGTQGNRGGDYNSLISALGVAGARSLVATHWLVDSDTAARVSTRVIRAAVGASGELATALQGAMKAEIGSSGRSRHPAFWAPFFLWSIAP